MEGASWQALWLLLFASMPVAFGIWRLFWRQKTNEQHDEPVKPMSVLGEALLKSLPQSVFFQGQKQFTKSVDSYWTNQQREIVPDSVIIPRSEAGVATAIAIIGKEFKARLENGDDANLPVFAVRGGGHSAMPGFSNSTGGFVIDLSLLNHVEPAQDLSSVWIGGGARWRDVYKQLDPLGIAVAGGRNADVGVGGLILGGGYSFFSPRVGFVCDNVLQFRVVLASGTAVTASQSENPDLWRSLKGGANNFGIITSVQMAAFPCAKIWGGFLYMFASKAPKAIQAFHNSVKSFDEYAAGPLVCISYVQKIGLCLIATHLMHTKPEAWPTFWKEFKDIGRIWSSVKVRSLTSATEELNSVSPSKFRHLHMCTVVKNDLDTLELAHKIFEKTIEDIKHIKGMTWTIVFQPVHSSTMRKGKTNIMGLENRKDDLIVTLFTAVWEQPSDDTTVNMTAKAALGEIDKFAKANGTADSFCYLNWCPNKSNPFESYGEENVRFMQKTSAKFDRLGLFQQGCIGGYKLPSKNGDQTDQ